MNKHPRATKSGLIKCSNCSHQLDPSAPLCPHCGYPWPFAQDKNSMKCPKCNKLNNVYTKRKYSRYNQWDRITFCGDCGARIKWFAVDVEAKKKWKAPPPTFKEILNDKEALQGIGCLMVIMIIAIIMWLI